MISYLSFKFSYKRGGWINLKGGDLKSVYSLFKHLGLSISYSNSKPLPVCVVYKEKNVVLLKHVGSENRENREKSFFAKGQ